MLEFVKLEIHVGEGCTLEVRAVQVSLREKSARMSPVDGRACSPRREDGEDASRMSCEGTHRYLGA